jgi:hypothetical protein
MGEERGNLDRNSVLTYGSLIFFRGSENSKAISIAFGFEYGK